MGKEDMGG